MSEAAALAAASISTSTAITTTTRRTSYPYAPFFNVVALAFASAGLVLMWERQQLSGSSLSVLPSVSTTAFFRSSSNTSYIVSSSSASSSSSGPSSSASSSLSSSPLSSSFHPTCDYPLYQQKNVSCPRFVNIDLISERGLGDRFLQFCIVLLVALDTSSVPILLDINTAPGPHGNYTGLEDFLPIGQSLPTIEEVRAQYPHLRQIRSGWPGSYRDKIAWLKAGGPKKQPTETGKEEVKQEGNSQEEEEKMEGDPGCNLLMTVNMDVCGDFRGEGCYFLDDPQYTRLKNLLRCWLLKMNRDTIPRLVWEDKTKGGGEGAIQVEQQKCYNVAIHLRVGDTLLHETDNLFFKTLKKTVGIALVGFECVHYHFFYEEEAMIEREKVEKKNRLEEILKLEREVKEKEGATAVENGKEEEKVEERRWVEGEPPFPILPKIFKEEMMVMEEVVVTGKEKKREKWEEEEGETDSEMKDSDNHTSQTRRKQRIRVSYHGKMDVRSTLYHLMDADMLVLTGSSFPYIASLLTPKAVVLFGTPKEARIGGGRPQTNGWVGGYWFGGYAVGGKDAGIALLTDEGKVVSPETDSEWKAMVEMKYLDAAGRKVPYV